MGLYIQTQAHFVLKVAHDVKHWQGIAIYYSIGNTFCINLCQIT